MYSTALLREPVPYLSTAANSALWIIEECMFMDLLTVTTVTDLATELFPHEHIALFLSAVHWPYFAGLFWPGLIHTTIPAAFLCSLNEHSPHALFGEKIKRPLNLIGKSYWVHKEIFLQLISLSLPAAGQLLLILVIVSPPDF